ncbi:hypothetical protein N7448_010187 [Penicillium atrosanguineum]|uniref:Uncharacterized protein n=1 Tax=Penicillium atrosanguineum TaxID=1132637 RepID=A0A9W9GFN4_9EURO|nr:uncharacterized protein N7443_007412 [Penicillium atrosanguineum]KAJ5119518.1 hypothetical protein N7448_010187 [Penicillium atrosanguineum]KAJ5296519.1 hypothetical protein N7443_007412 [Penicillium atrosanguineum]KAJ5299282.1 hypothetical protein N7476_010839 [Penicillium atrosanguineum]
MTRQATQRPHAVTSTGRLYFLDIGLPTYPEHNGRILTCKPDGSDIRELITEIRTLPDGINVDVDHQHIYWTNMVVPSAKDGFIQRCDLSGEYVVTIIPARRILQSNWLLHESQENYTGPTEKAFCDSRPGR